MIRPQTFPNDGFSVLSFSAVTEDGVRQVGFGMLCLTAITWLSVGGCQRSVVSSPERMWSGANRSGYGLAPVPEPDAIRPPVVSIPPVITGNPWKPSAPLRDWKHIVIHHTASESGSVETINAAHLARKDKNGVAWKGIGYHFLIGNGSGMGDGEIEPTFRWRQQMQGAHAGDEEYNQRGIGICLVGNFEDHRPSIAQLTAVKRLVGVMKSEYHIHGDHVVGHRSVKSTACPGKLFPLSEIAQVGDLPAFGSRAEMLQPQFVQAQGGSTE